MIETAVLAEIERLKRATFVALCDGLPFQRRSISEALRRLSAKKIIARKIGCAGDFWTITPLRPTKLASHVGGAPTKNG